MNEELPKFAQAIELVKQAHALLLQAHELAEGDLPEVLVEMDRLPPELFGQLVVEHMGHVYSEPFDRIFWVRVANHIGLDNIEGLRKAAAFMNKVSEF